MPCEIISRSRPVGVLALWRPRSRVRPPRWSCETAIASQAVAGHGGEFHVPHQRSRTQVADQRRGADRLRGNGRDIAADELSRAMPRAVTATSCEKRRYSRGGWKMCTRRSKGVFTNATGRARIRALPGLAYLPRLGQQHAGFRSEQSDSAGRARVDPGAKRRLGVERRLRAAQGPARRQSVAVPSNVAGEQRRVERHRLSSGEIRLSLTGSDNRRREFRFAERVPSGALIGRVEQRQAVFHRQYDAGLSNAGDGTLFLGVNDDHVPDNSGNYVVEMWEPVAR